MLCGTIEIQAFLESDLRFRFPSALGLDSLRHIEADAGEVFEPI